MNSQVSFLKWLLFVGLLGQAGCGSPTIANHQNFEDLCPVVGQVDFKGEVIPDATINFYPAGVVLNRNSVPVASGVVDETGAFEIYTYREQVKGRGVAPGDYDVSFSWSGPLKGLTDEQIDELAEKLPAKYLNPATSGIKVTIAGGDNVVPAISLK